MRFVFSLLILSFISCTSSDYRSARNYKNNLDLEIIKKAQCKDIKTNIRDIIGIKGKYHINPLQIQYKSIEYKINDLNNTFKFY